MEWLPVPGDGVRSLAEGLRDTLAGGGVPEVDALAYLLTASHRQCQQSLAIGEERDAEVACVARSLDLLMKAIATLFPSEENCPEWAACCLGFNVLMIRRVASSISSTSAVRAGNATVFPVILITTRSMLASSA